MSSPPSKRRERAKLLRQALSRWDNEGGAPLGQVGTVADGTSPTRATDLPLTNAELVQLQIRVIALENLVLALLTGASDAQLALAQDIGASISPRPNTTMHRLTTHAVAQMEHLLLRSQTLKDKPSL